MDNTITLPFDLPDGEQVTEEYNYGPEPQKAGAFDYDGDDRRIRVGNNRYHQPKLAAKRRAKLAKASRKRNRK